MEASNKLHAPVALPRYPLDWKLSGPRAGLDAVAKRRISAICRESNPSSQYTDWPTLGTKVAFENEGSVKQKFDLCLTLLKNFMKIIN